MKQKLTPGKQEKKKKAMGKNDDACYKSQREKYLYSM